MECPGRQESLGGWRMGAAQLFSGTWETTIFYNGTEVIYSIDYVIPLKFDIPQFS